MKFGKQIQDQAFPEWSHHYMNYKGLKKIIGKPNQISHGVITIASLNSEITEDEEKSSQSATFFFRLDRELEKVNSFYLKKENELQVRLRSLLDKKKVISNKKDFSKQLGVWKNLQEAFIKYQQDLDKLQQFVEINGTGFRKILKKWDKVNRQSMKDSYLSRQVKVQKCFNKEVMADLADSCSFNLMEIQSYIENGSSSNNINQQDENEIEILEGDNDENTDNLEEELFQAILSGIPSLLEEKLNDISHLQTNKEFNMSSIFWRACSENSSMEIITILLKYKQLINFNYVDDISYRSCLHEVTINGNLNLIPIIIKHQTDLNLVDIYGRSALHYSSIYGNLNSMKLLLSSGADAHPLDHEGFTALLYAVSGGFTDCVEVLLNEIGELKEDVNQALSLASQHGHKDILILLLNKIKNMSTLLIGDQNGLHPLHLACREGHQEICLLLTEHGADLNAIDSDKGWTPLFYAASDGHLSCLKILLEAGCNKDVYDESGLTPVYYAAYEGHSECVELLLSSGCPNSMQANQVNTNINGEKNQKEFSIEEHTNGSEILDEIPSLLLPPPLLPFRIYGHNYLDKRYLVQVKLGWGSNRPAVHLYGNSKITSLKLIMNPKQHHVENNIINESQSVILPLAEDHETINFEVNSLDNFSLEFSIFPTFGSKVIGKGVALSSHFNYKESKSMCIPLFDSHLKVVGEVNFSFNLVKPYNNVNLEVGGKIQTYWKAPVQETFIGTNGSIASLVTASSLAQEYIQLGVQLTKDSVPIVYSDWTVSIQQLEISPFTMTFEQFKNSSNNTSNSDEFINQLNEMDRDTVIKNINDQHLSLREIMGMLPHDLGLCLDIKYPHFMKDIHLPDINTFTDTVLDQIYEMANSSKIQRSFIFSSFYPPICNALNWKQPNYAVFISTGAGFSNEEDAREINSIKSAVQFAKRNNLLGIIAEATPLIKVPLLIQFVKEQGFLLASYGKVNDAEKTEVDSQIQSGVDATIRKGFLYYASTN